MYESYAAIYDLAQQGRLGELLAYRALAWLATQGHGPWRALDLACGTGAAALALASAGCDVLGVDRSAAMLGVAQAKAQGEKLAPRWLERDICALEHERGIEPGSYDLATCLTDSVNYVLDEQALAGLFRGAARALRPGGRLLFDLNTEAEYATWPDRDVLAHSSGDLLLYQRLRYNQRTRLGTGKIGWFVREIDRWWRGEETHTQRAWRPAEIAAALDTAGLRVLSCEPTEGSLDGRRATYWCERRTERSETK